MIGRAHEAHARTRYAVHGIDLIEHIDQRAALGAARQHDDAVAQRLADAGAARREQHARCLPARATITRAGQHRRAMSCRVEPVPHGVDVARIGGVGGQRGLVVEEGRSILRQQLGRRPGDAAVGRTARHQPAGRARLQRRTAENQAEHMRRAVGAEVDPGVGDAFEITGAAGGGAAAARHGLHRALPGRAAVQADGADQRPRTATAPAVLLPGREQVPAIGRVQRGKGFDLGIHVQRAAGIAARASRRHRRGRADALRRQVGQGQAGRGAAAATGHDKKGQHQRAAVCARHGAGA